MIIGRRDVGSRSGDRLLCQGGAPGGEDALNALSDALTTEDLKALNAKVDGESQETSQVAEGFIKEKGLL